MVYAVKDSKRKTRERERKRESQRKRVIERGSNIEGAQISKIWERAQR